VTTFALIHGGWGTGWHWASIPERLRAAGHEVVAPDLPCDDPDATFEDYAQVVIDALGGAEDVVAVGFSLGGMTAARVPAREHVYVAALVPEPGSSLIDQYRHGQLLHREYLAGVARSEDGATRWVDFEAYRRLGYDERVPEAVVRERFDRLRPQYMHPYSLPFEGDAVPVTRYVRCTRDRIINNELWATLVDVTDELDCGHGPMAARPEELTRILLG
jgi:pimeloyl-ACP methyl ester carboxylesterase